MSYNQSTEQFETPFLEEYTSARELFTEDAKAGRRALDDLILASTSIRSVLARFG
jgi:hypothetical protein